MQNNRIEKINFYEDFKCTADACTFTCCKEWKITVDELTFQKWKTMDKKKKGSGKLCNHIKNTEAGKIIGLDALKKCPFLNEKKLCNLVLEHGDQILSKTCTLFPRKIQKFKDRTEYSMTVCCPAVVDLLKDHGQKMEVLKSSEQGTKDSLYQLRGRLMELVKNEEYTVCEALLIGFYMLLEEQEHEQGQKPKQAQVQEKDATFFATLKKAIQTMPYEILDVVWERNELFLDVIENYRVQGIYDDYLEELQVQAGELEIIEDVKLLEEIARFETVIKPYDSLFRSYLYGEIFSNGLFSDFTLQDMILALEWLAIEFAVIRHALFLSWRKDQYDELPYEILRDILVVMARITGYEMDDIEEYLETSFESMIWEWGYFALLVGR